MLFSLVCTSSYFMTKRKILMKNVFIVSYNEEVKASKIRAYVRSKLIDSVILLFIISSRRMKASTSNLLSGAVASISKIEH